MEFKKLILFLTLFSINILQCADSASGFVLEPNSLASLGMNASGSVSDFEKNGQGSLAESYSGSFGFVPGSSDSVSVSVIPEVCVVKKRVEKKETENGKRFDHFDANPDRCVVDPRRTEEVRTKFNSQYQEMMKECSVSHPEVKEYMADLNIKTDQNIKNNLENAKIEARNIMAVLDGQEAPLKTYLKLAMATAMQRGIKKILPGCDAKRKREIKNFYRISHLCKMIEQIFPDILDYCKDYICTQKLDRNSDGHIDAVYALARLGKNLFASGSLDHTIKIWAIDETGQCRCIQTIDRNSGGHDSSVRALTRLGKNLFASGSTDTTIKIWAIDETNQCRCIQTIDRNSGGHINSVCALTRLRKNLFASGSWDTTIKIWAIDETSQCRCIQIIDRNSGGHNYSVFTFARLGKNLFASGSLDNTIKIWAIDETGQCRCIQTIDRNSGGHDSSVNALTRLEKNLFASGSLDNTIKIWAIDETGQCRCIQTIDRNSGGHIDRVWALTRLGKNIFASGSDDETIKIWKLNSEKQKVLIEQTIKIERESLFKSEYSMLDAVDRLIWNQYTTDNRIEIQPIQKEPIREEQSWFSWAWENKYKIALCLAVAFAVYIKLFKD